MRHKTKKDQKKSSEPVKAGHKSFVGGQIVSGSPESQGGSREGNAGHMSSAEGGRGDRQV